MPHRVEVEPLFCRLPSGLGDDRLQITNSITFLVRATRNSAVEDACRVPQDRGKCNQTHFPLCGENCTQEVLVPDTLVIGPVTLQAPKSRVPTFPRQIVFVIGISTPH